MNQRSPSPDVILVRRMAALAFTSFLVLTLLAVLIIVQAKGAEGRTIIVDDDTGPGGNGTQDRPFSRIQDAIYNATTGDIIRVFNGTYHENLVVNRSMTLTGNGSSNTTIVGGGNGDVVTLNANGTTMTGFTVMNSGFWFAGIHVAANNTNITNVQCRENYFGIDLFYSNGSIIERSVCRNNSGRGIYVYRSNRIELSENECDWNNYSGISLNSSHNIDVIDNICSNNGNFGIRVTNSDYCDLMNNTAKENGDAGVGFFSSNNGSVMNSSLQSNVRGIKIVGSRDITITNSSIHNNTIGILFASSPDNNVVIWNQIENNSEFGIQVKDQDVVVNATMNWWGDETGPHHWSDNSKGKGNTVSNDVIFNPWIGRDRIVRVDFDLIDSFDTSHILNIDGSASVFYSDSLHLISDVFVPEGRTIISYEWEFADNVRWMVTMDSGEFIYLTVGVDHLYYWGLPGSPIMPRYNSNPREYTITLTVTDDTFNTTSNTMDVTVHPLAQKEFVVPVRMGTSLLDVTVDLIWRGFEEEVAPTAQYISPERPVFVFIHQTTSPDQNLSNVGGVGFVYDIRAVGCMLQNGEEGFINATIQVPIHWTGSRC